MSRLCAGHRRDGTPCMYAPRPASRYCARHADQRPEVPIPWLVEGRARRAPAGPVFPRLHLLVARAPVEPDIVLCTGRPAGRRESPAVARPCPACRRLALAAVTGGEIEPDTLRRWELGEPNVDERANAAPTPADPSL